MDYLKLLVICTFLIVVFNIIGNFVYEKFSIDESKMPLKEWIGFIAFLGCYQLLIYIPQFFHWHTIFNCLIIFVLGAVFIYYVKPKNILSYLKFDKIILIPIAVAFLFVVLMYFNPGTIWVNNTADSAFYLPMINDNSVFNLINAVNPSTGTPKIIIYIYAFQGINQLLGGLGMLFFTKGSLVCIWVVPFLVNFLFFELIINTCFVFSKKCSPIKIAFIVFLGIALQFTEYNLIYGYYPTSLRPICFYSMILLYLYSLKCNYKVDKKMIFLVSIANIAVHSSSLFIIIMCAVTLFLVSMYNNIDYNFTWSYYLILPAMINAMFVYFYKKSFLAGAIIVIATLLIILVYNKFDFLLKEHCKIFKVIISVVFLFLIFARFYIKDAPMNFRDFFDNSSTTISSIYSLVYLKEYTFTNFLTLINYVLLFIFIVSLIFNSKYKKYKNFGLFIIIFYLLFYNPLSITYVSKFITLAVYPRIEIVVFNNYYIILMFCFISFNLVLKLLFATLCCVNLETQISNFYINNNAIKYMNENYDLNRLYKIDESLIDMGNYFNRMTKRVKIECASSVFNTRIYSSNIEIDLKYTLNAQRRGELLDRLPSILENSNNNLTMDNIEDIIGRLEKTDSQYIIIKNNMEADVKEVLCKYFKLVHKNKNYLIYIK